MKGEGWLFAGTALFFAATTSVYWALSREPAGTAALTVAFLMSSLVAFFFFIEYRRRGLRAQDRREADIAETVGRLAFFPPRSAWPVTIAVGVTLLALGVVFGLWLFLIGCGLLAGAVFGFVFQHSDRWN
jgi:hypothetical protein